MKERPIPFCGPMVLAILNGTKTQTRRPVKLPRWAMSDREDVPDMELYGGALCATSQYSGGLAPIPCPYGQPGDRLWVRETFSLYVMEASERPPVFYKADDDPKEGWSTPQDIRWRSPRFMPRWASRITLEITEVRVQRLQDIREEDAKAEGAPLEGPTDGCIGNSYYRRGFLNIWNSIHGPGSWDANPYVWAISFRRVQP